MSLTEEIRNITQKLDAEMKVIVSVALFGQPGAGKSSLINKMVGKNLAVVGVETDKTVERADYEINGIRFSDLPGYGTVKFPKETYFDKFNIMDFDLFLCVTSGKLHQADTEFFREVIQRGKVCIFVVNKRDDLWEDGVSLEELQDRKAADISKSVGDTVKIIFTSCRDNYGLDALQDEISANLGAAKQERWSRSAKAYSVEQLEKKREACEKYVTIASAAAAANAINPIPGADIAVDVTILYKLFAEIRAGYGLNDEALSVAKNSQIQVMASLSNNIVKYAAKEGILYLLKSFIGRVALKSVAKYIPFVGQAIAAGLGFAITKTAGDYYLNECHQLAEETLNRGLNL